MKNIALSSRRSSRTKSSEATSRAYCGGLQKCSPSAKPFQAGDLRTEPMPLRTPLYELHRSAGSTFIEFGGWEMPLQFSGIVAEHLAVRAGAGLFDVSHMGKLLISGAGARDFLNRISANEISKSPNRARYTHLLDDTGRIIDDVIVTCLGPERFFMVCNAGPREKVIAWMRKHSHDVKIEDRTFEYLCLALQGPKAARVLQLLTQYDITSIKGFSGAYCDLLLGERPGTGRVARSAPPETGGRGPFFGGPEVGNGDFCYVTRTGYRGEEG